MKNIILLNGPSLENAKPSFTENDRVFAINRKSKIEDKFGNVNFWVLRCTNEFLNMIEEVYEFLNRSEENRIITTSLALLNARSYLEVRPLPNPHRIILIDSLMSDVSNQSAAWHDLRNYNSLFFTLYLLALVDETTPTFIYGMDGAEKDSETIYFNQEKLFEERGKWNAIYDDMIVFDGNFWQFMESKKLRPIIFNMNEKSFYKSLPFRKKTYSSTYGTEKFFTSNLYSNKELLEKANQRAAAIEQEKINYPIELILRRLKKPNWFSRIFKKIKDLLK